MRAAAPARRSRCLCNRSLGLQVPPRRSTKILRVEFRDLIRVVYRRKAVVALVFVLTVGISAALAASRSKRYESTATLAIAAKPAQSPSGGTPLLLRSDDLATVIGTYAQSVKSQVTMSRAQRLLRRPLPGTVDTSTEAGTGILRIIGKADRPADAVVVARAVTAVIQRSLDRNPLIATRVIGEPQASSSPVPPSPALIVAVGTLLGLFGGLLVAAAVENLRRRVDTPEALAAVSDAPLIGEIPNARRLKRGSAQEVWTDPGLASLHEGVRALRTNLGFRLPELQRTGEATERASASEALTDTDAPGTQGVATTPVASFVQVTSAKRGAGKSTLVSQLGIALARSGVRTLIIDADLRAPQQHVNFNVGNTAGLTALLRRPDDLDGPQPVDVGVEGLQLLPAGTTADANWTELLEAGLSYAVGRLGRLAEVVLVDSAPLLPVADARIVARGVDGVVVVINARDDSPDAVGAALETLALAGAPVLGAVLNRAPARQGAAYGGYYGG